MEQILQQCIPDHIDLSTIPDPPKYGIVKFFKEKEAEDPYYGYDENNLNVDQISSDYESLSDEEKVKYEEGFAASMGEYYQKIKEFKEQYADNLPQLEGETILENYDQILIQMWFDLGDEDEDEDIDDGAAGNVTN